MTNEQQEFLGIFSLRLLLIRASGDDTPIIAFTANLMQKHRDSFDAVGCNGFLGKPIDRDALNKVFEEYLSIGGSVGS